MAIGLVEFMSFFAKEDVGEAIELGEEFDVLIIMGDLEKEFGCGWFGVVPVARNAKEFAAFCVLLHEFVFHADGILQARNLFGKILIEVINDLFGLFFAMDDDRPHLAGGVFGVEEEIEVPFVGEAIVGVKVRDIGKVNHAEEEDGIVQSIKQAFGNHGVPEEMVQ